ncbi:MAG: glycosyltransferase family A protein [Rikenellaceae bacterium]
MKFSIVMASRLEFYPGAASNRDAKLIRAINSVINQTYEDWELHVIADGCQKTIDIVQSNVKDLRLHLWKVAHTKLWSGRPRNKGIEEAQGEFIVYLDIDDVYGKDHLKIIAQNLNAYDWVWYNDFRYRNKTDYWYENHCNINKAGAHGTSNICHKRNLNVFWNENDKYAHDYNFVRKLIPFSNNSKIITPEYYCCHVPGNGISGGYDI